MNSKLFLTVTIATIATAMVAGILIVGGPIQGRHDKFDEQRFRELNELARALLCDFSSGPTNRLLPNELSVETMRTHCSGAGISAAALTDNETGEPYTYNRINDHDFSICAAFYDIKRTERLIGAWRHATFDSNTGCMSGRIR